MEYSRLMNKIQAGVTLFMMKYLVDPQTVTMSCATRSIIENAINEQRSLLLTVLGLPNCKSLGFPV